MTTPFTEQGDPNYVSEHGPPSPVWWWERGYNGVAPWGLTQRAQSWGRASLGFVEADPQAEGVDMAECPQGTHVRQHLVWAGGHREGHH